jgi:hypothetical protein
MNRKMLINEVLPKPSPSPAGSVRDRAVQNARRLLTNGAIAGGALVTACYTVVDPLPPPCPSFTTEYLPTGAATFSDAVLTVRLSSGYAAGWEVNGNPNSVTGVKGGQPFQQQYGVFGFTVDPDATTLFFQAQAICDGRQPGPVTLYVRVDLRDSADGGIRPDPRVTVSTSEIPDGGP